MMRFFILLLSCLFSWQAYAHATSQSTLIESIGYFQQPAHTPIEWPQAITRFENQHYTHATDPFLTFGISDATAWVQISVDNPTSHTLSRRLTAAQTWVDDLSVYFITPAGLKQAWHTGDAQPADRHLLPTKGLVFHLTVPPGTSRILIRARTLDPLTLPIELESLDHFQTQEPKNYLASGLLYGVLLALTGFNIALFTIFKQPYALYYAIYMTSFVIMNMGYNGYAYAWLYPNSPQFQNFSTLFFMVLHGVFGLAFMANFLDLKQRLPHIQRFFTLYGVLGIISISLTTLLAQHYLSAVISFGFLAITSVFMILTGLAIFRTVPDARYFLLAVSCSMLGLLISTLSVYGILPYTFYGYRGAEIGVFLEAIILAVVIAYRLKAIEIDRVTAKFQASYDPLTHLPNRRSFERAAAQLMHSAQQKQQLLSLVILDIDHFKHVNDTYGHHAGDLVLKHLADILRGYMKTHDAMARWGGEEIVLLISEPSRQQAQRLTEQLRATIEASPTLVDGQYIYITASFGLAYNDETSNLSQLIKLADSRLYFAKHQGRNRISYAPSDAHQV